MRIEIVRFSVNSLQSSFTSAIKSPTSLSPLLFLLLTVVVSLAHRLQVVDVPKQLLIAVVRLDVVGDWTVVRRICPDAENACLLAGVVITHKRRLSELLPPRGLVPLAPSLRLVSIAMALRFGFLPCCWRYR
ncbi:hypothetical protein [Rhizobium sp. S96]|uniref:hypothetical protein n=1 Tax=Rhizobium sp. S96 TaxID=3055140 RepID=UPI0025AADFEA|nr:hypothetical protein [Rhizobium sp. S96]MDM9619091.1 hypothetical protein [Rhizobium sp. S96]